MNNQCVIDMMIDDSRVVEFFKLALAMSLWPKE
jgi:hypothetical protein